MTVFGHTIAGLAAVSVSAAAFTLAGPAIRAYIAAQPTSSPAVINDSQFHPKDRYRCACGKMEIRTGEVSHEGAVIYRCPSCGAESSRPDHFR